MFHFLLVQTSSQPIKDQIRINILHLFNPLSTNIHIKILQTDFHMFPWKISWENLLTDQGTFPLVVN